MADQLREALEKIRDMCPTEHEQMLYPAETMRAVRMASVADAALSAPPEQPPIRGSGLPPYLDVSGWETSQLLTQFWPNGRGSVVVPHNVWNEISNRCRPALTREDAERLADEFVVLWNETCRNIFAKPGYEQALETWKLTRRNMLADALQRVAGERTHRVPCADPECRLCHFQLTDEDRAIEGEKK